MMELAKSHDVEIVPAPNKGNLRATEESKTSNNLQVHELQELMDVILADKEKNGEGGIRTRPIRHNISLIMQLIDFPIDFVSPFG
jgi:hypothetical protein